jgi:hypothetical protein
LPEGGETTTSLFMRRDWFELLTKCIRECREVGDEVQGCGIERDTTFLKLPPSTGSSP